VLKETGNRQEPFVYGSLGGEDVPLVPAKPVVSTATPAAPASNPQADARRDYELALQVGNKSALNAFLAQHPDGFYASLARLQLEKIAAEDARVAATEKARLAEQERARLAAEGAQKAQQAKAEADARAAEQARIAAEKAKQIAQDQAIAAERNRAAAETLANVASAGDKDQQIAQDQAVAAERNRAATETLASVPPTGDKAQSEKGINLAALTSGPPPADLAKSVQTELRRVGCLTAAADGEWNAASQRSMALFNRHAGTKFDVRLASINALDAIKLKSSRVCPLVCEHGFRADGDRCGRISCAVGSFLNDDNECEKRREKQPVATRDRPERKRAPEARQVPQAKQAIAGRSQTQTGAGLGSKGQPLTGTERERGCNSYGAIMSGVCP
jgi:hypothetical protein